MLQNTKEEYIKKVPIKKKFWDELISRYDTAHIITWVNSSAEEYKTNPQMGGRMQMSLCMKIIGEEFQETKCKVVSALQIWNK